jgi:hypothetical protein
MTVLVDTAEHTAKRPSWDCRRCGHVWPCDSARERMIIEMDRVSLAVFTWINLEEAIGDLPPYKDKPASSRVCLSVRPSSVMRQLRPRVGAGWRQLRPSVLVSAI